jgi:hypothetical protein
MGPFTGDAKLHGACKTRTRDENKRDEEETKARTRETMRGEVLSCWALLRVVCSDVLYDLLLCCCTYKIYYFFYTTCASLCGLACSMVLPLLWLNA